MHRSRLGAIIIDCQTDDLEREANFRSAALGGAVGRRDAEVERLPQIAAGVVDELPD